MVNVYFRPLVSSSPIDDTGFTTLDQYNVPVDLQQNYLEALYLQYAAALALGQPVYRARVSSAIANAMQGREFSPLQAGEILKFAQCGEDKQHMELWEDRDLPSGTAYIE